MKQVSSEKYVQLLNLQKSNCTPYSEHIQGSRRTLIVYNKVVCTTIVGGSFLDIGSISDSQFISFLATFKRGLYAAIKKNPEIAYNKISFKGTSRSKNKAKFDSIPVNDFYWNIDIVSAYWQMGYRLGYVSKTFYTKYMHNPAYKQVKRLAFSFLARTNFRLYVLNDNKYRIDCDNTIHQTVYDNVRNELYSIISRVVEEAKDDYIDYNIDSVSVTKYKKDQILNYFKGLGIEVKATPVIKISEKEYSHKDRIRKF